MSKKFVIALAMVASLAACRDNNQATQEPVAPPTPTETPAPVVEPAPVAPVAPPVAMVPALQAPLAGGVQTLPFRFHVAVEREVTAKKTGKVVREVGIEFFDGTVDEVDAQMAEAFKQGGYARDKGEPQGHAIRSVYKKAGSSDVLVWVRRGAPRGERFKLQMPDAKGTVYMAWDVASN